MGVSASACLPSDHESSAKSKPGRFGFEDIPESCIALVLTHLNPPEICKLARLNRAFRAAASADFIWDSKLPSNYRYIVDKLSNQDFTGLGKKGLYGSLCRRNPFDGGTREIWLDKETGGVCLLISSKAMAITGIDDRRYWTHLPTEESRFETIAYLQQTWWLEVVGDINFQFPVGCYSLFFRLQLGRATKKRLRRRICNLDHIHGWDIKPVQFSLTTSDGQHATSRCFLDNPGNWVHYHVGDFVVDEPNQPIGIKFSLRQIDCTHTKGGVCIDSVLVCPTSLAKEWRDFS